MSTNTSKIRRENLLNNIKEIYDFILSSPQDENTKKLLLYINEVVNDINGQKYGLVFENHVESIDEKLTTHVPVLSEYEELFIKKGGSMNFLIEGDNLSALTLLNKTHKEKIDLIYIDPPYNTGNLDFIYDDKYIDENDSYKHSKWLSFMNQRLKMARKLLSPQGVIFIQINDIELAQLKLLCDSIFGEENFLNVISVNMKNIAGASGGGEDKKFKKNCEYILIYAKNYSLLPIFNGSYVYTEMSELIQSYLDEGISWKYTSVLLDEGEKEYIGSTVDGDGNEIKVYSRKSPIIKSIKQVAKDEKISEKDAYKKYGLKIFRTTNSQSSIRTRILNYRKELSIEDDLISIEYIPKTGKNKGEMYEQFYKGDKCNLFVWLRDTSEVIDGELYKKDLQGTYWDATAGTKNLTKEGNVEFASGKKPLDLIKQIINLYPSEDITVLDFFAGSGTTGHAVIDLNSITGRNSRKFILCTNNQNNICKEKTYKRLSNVINGYITDKGKKVNGLEGSLKYYKIDYIEVSDKFYYEYADELMKHIKELVELENGVDFTSNEVVQIVLTDEEISELLMDTSKLEKCEIIYKGHDALLSGLQLSKLKEYDIQIKVIPDYYYFEIGDKK